MHSLNYWVFREHLTFKTITDNMFHLCILKKVYITNVVNRFYVLLQGNFFFSKSNVNTGCHISANKFHRQIFAVTREKPDCKPHCIQRTWKTGGHASIRTALNTGRRKPRKFGLKQKRGGRQDGWGAMGKRAGKRGAFEENIPSPLQA